MPAINLFLAIVGSAILQILFASTATLAAAEAEVTPDESAKAQVVLSGATEIPLLPDHKTLAAKTPVQVQIYQLDATPLGERSPLLFVHGGGGERKEMFRWDKVVNAFVKDPEFNAKYKVYFLRYDSEASLPGTVNDAVEVLLNFASKNPTKKITAVALSMGGNVMQGALADSRVDAVIARLFALGTPFHGSPLFSADWYQYSLHKNKFQPMSRLFDSLDYRAYFSRHRNYQKDLKWDNVDQAMPDVGKFHSITPLGPKGNLTVTRDANPLLSTFNKEIRIDKGKITAYAGYLLNKDVLDMTRKQKMRSYLLAPYHFFTVRVPAQLGREQPALKVLNAKVGRVVSDSGYGKAKLYALNDGITPISSAIFLSAKATREYPILKESDLIILNDIADIRKARVFRNIDHITFIEGSPPHRGSSFIKDEVHPIDGAHTIFDWMLNDLLDRSQNTHVAAGSESGASQSD